MLMKLYKNVDVQDLESILEKGILSLEASKNDNWMFGNRSNNATNVVYLFEALTEINTFTQYGLALLEIEISSSSVIKTKLTPNDSNTGMYNEYVTSFVPVTNIKKIYVPKIFKERLQVILTPDVFNKINFVEIEANAYRGGKLQNATEEQLAFVSRTSTLNTTDFNFFRGTEEYKEVVDLYDIIYKI